MDLMTPLTAGLVAFASKDMIAKLLGPTFDYLGGGLKSFVEKRHDNVMSIFAKTNKKLGDKLNDEGTVNPRVLKHILDEGSFCEDNLTQEYFAGLLASSRTAIEENIAGGDKSLPYLSIVEQMSATNILFHYLLYYSFVMKVFREEHINLFEESNITKYAVYFPITTALQIFGGSNLTVMMSEVCSHALKEKLINEYKFGKLPESETNSEVEASMLRVKPTLFGLTLFLKANAAPDNILSSASSEEKASWVDELDNQTSIAPLPIILAK